MRLPAAIVSRFERPTGLIGSLLARNMARLGAMSNALALDELDVQATDHVLELGFGPGLGLSMAARRAHRGQVVGVDVTPDMMRMAGKRNQRFIEQGRVVLVCAPMERLPYPAHRFDKIFTVNTIYFLPDPVACLTEARRTLKDGGAIAVSFRARESIDPRFYPPVRTYWIREVEDLVRASGFRDLTIAHRSRGTRTQHVITARK